MVSLMVMEQLQQVSLMVSPQAQLLVSLMVSPRAQPLVSLMVRPQARRLAA